MPRRALRFQPQERPSLPADPLVSQVFMAVTASAASEQIAVSSIVSHDLYLRYVNPRATGRQVLFAARCGIVGWACGSGVLAVLLLSLDIGLGWAYNAMGNFIGSAVAPIAFALTWRDCSAAGALAGAWVGAAVALLTWTLCARRLGALSVATLGDETCMLSGNLAALLVSPAITVAVSLLAPQRFDWRLLRERTGGSGDAAAAEDHDRAKRPAEEAAPAAAAGEAGGGSGGGVQELLFGRPRVAVGALCFVLIVAWPLLALIPDTFSKGYWGWWVAISFLWSHCAAAVAILLPLYQIRHLVWAHMCRRREVGAGGKERRLGQLVSDALHDLERGGGGRDSFDPALKEAFKTAKYKPEYIRAAAGVSASLMLANYASEVGSGAPSSDALVCWALHLISGTASLILFVLFSLRGFRRLCMRRYELLCAFWAVQTFALWLGTFVLLEVRRASYHPGGGGDYIRYGLNFSSGWPLRECNDSDPVRTIRSWPNLDGPGCSNQVYSARCMGVCILIAAAPSVLLVSMTTAYAVAIFNTTVFIVASVAVGTNSGLLVLGVAVVSFAGFSAANCCEITKLDSKEEFALVDGTKRAAERSRTLLHTLIPPNVLSQLTVHDSRQGMLCKSIERCTVMFCSLEPISEMRPCFSESLFNLTHEVFSVFDAAVERWGMFKYQHVSEWYIVACPRAARPYDLELQEQPYPLKHCEDMVLLGRELVQLAGKFATADGQQLWLKVGISCGPVAGAVVGKFRSFYCLLGDTMNTAARMCKYAQPGNVHCSAEFAGSFPEHYTGPVRFSSLGKMQVKGKGLMETYVAMDRIKDECETPESPKIPQQQESSSPFPSISPQNHETNNSDRSDPHIMERMRSSFENLRPHSRWPSQDIVVHHSAEGQLIPKRASEESRWSTAARSLEWGRFRLQWRSESSRGTWHMNMGLFETSFAERRQLSLADLSPAGVAWVSDQRHQLDRRLAMFSDPGFESEFQSVQARRHRIWVVAGLRLHIATSLLQWLQVVWPDYPPYFQDHGDEGLRASMLATSVLLGVHWGLSTFLCVALEVCIRWGCVSVARCRAALVGLKLLLVLVSVAASHLWPLEAYNSVFGIEMAAITGVSVSRLTLPEAAVLAAATVLAGIPNLLVQPLSVGALLRAALLLAAEVGLCVWLVHSVNVSDRERWWLQRLHEEELVHLRRVLSDLLPTHIASRWFCKYIIRRYLFLMCIMAKIIYLRDEMSIVCIADERELCCL